VFSTAADKPTAAVLLSLAPGTRLGRDQVRSVTHLVAGSVPNLDPNDVTVSDSTGALLSTRGLGADSAAGAAGDADAQTALYEDRMTGKLQEMLDRVLGTGNAVVKVSAQLNFDTRNTTTENYLASPSVPPLSESTTTETYAPGAAGAGGVLGVPTPSAVAGGAKGGGYAKSEGTVNRALGKQVTNEEAAPGSVQRLSVAVVLDAATTKGADVKKVMALVGNAAGIDAKRGDTVQVDQLPFDTTTAANAAKEVAAAQKQAQLDQYVGLGEKAGAVLAAVVIGLLLLKRSKAGPTVEVTAGDLPMFTQSRVEAIGAARVLPAAEPKELTAEPADPLPLERERLRDEVSSMVDNQPDDIAQLVQGWLGQQG
jgi:flagellar M-ring protein FliF